MIPMTSKARASGWRLTCDKFDVGTNDGGMFALSLDNLSDEVPEGAYFAIRGHVDDVDRSHVARLSVTCRDWRRYDITLLISRRGRIFELISLSAPILKAELFIDLDGAPAQGFVLEIQPLSRQGYRARQIHRIIRVMRRPQRAHLKAVGTTWNQISNLDALYKLASQFRANVFTHSYAEWFNEFYTLTAGDRRRITRIIHRWQNPPTFIVFIDGRGANKSDIQFTLDSVSKQLYGNFQVTILQDASSGFPDSPTLGHSSTPEKDLWALMLTAGSTLEDYALFWLADAISVSPAASVIYTDHDTIAPDLTLRDPCFKPDFSLELLRSQNYIGESYCWRVSDIMALVESIGSTKHYARLLDLSRDARVDTAVHVPACLIHLPISKSSAIDVVSDDAVVSRHLEDTGVRASVCRTSKNVRRISYHLPTPPPLVSIVIPTRNGLAHLRPCVESVLRMSTYPGFEVLVVDNQSDDPDALAYLEQLKGRAGVRVLIFDEPFNYSRMNNFAVRHAHGDWICLLNNDTEVISADWLEDMGGYLSQPDVGVVGAKLLYSDGTVQHAGDAVGPGGCADHFHSGLDRDDPGYAGRAVVAQDLSAVTAACLLTKRHVFWRLNGLDEGNLPVAFNDVDYCLRVREAGLRVVWTPHALLYHHESVSRGKDVSPEQIRRAASEVKYMQKRWQNQLRHDPFYNPNLSYLRPDFSLSTTPRVRRPWKKSHV